MRVARAAPPFVAALFKIALTHVPVLSTWLPVTLMGPEIVTR